MASQTIQAGTTRRKEGKREGEEGEKLQKEDEPAAPSNGRASRVQSHSLCWLQRRVGWGGDRLAPPNCRPPQFQFLGALFRPPARSLAPPRLEHHSPPSLPRRTAGFPWLPRVGARKESPASAGADSKPAAARPVKWDGRAGEARTAGEESAADRPRRGRCIEGEPSYWRLCKEAFYKTMTTASNLCSIWTEIRALRRAFYLLFLLLQFPVGWGKGDSDETSDVETEFTRIDSILTRLEKPGKSRGVIREDPFIHLQHLESILVETQFQGHHKRFGQPRLFANVHKISPQPPEHLSIEEKVQGDEINQFQVTLSKSVLAKGAKVNQEGRVVMLAATSPVLFKDNDSHPILGGKVIGISVGNTSVHGLLPKERISITIWHNHLQRNVTPLCVFWVMGPKPGDIGKWNTSGCEVVRGKNQTTCLCDHLTFFAVLMVPLSDIDEIHKKYLDVATFVGCIISALASLVTIVFLCLRKKQASHCLCPHESPPDSNLSGKKQRDHVVFVHVNLLWAIFLIDVSFLIVVHLAPFGGDIACKAGGMFLHFCVLACLTWMAIEGYTLYRMVIEVFNSYVKCLLVKLSLMGWGLPLLIVCLILGIDQSYYGPFSIKVYKSPENYTNTIICWSSRKEINSFLNLGYLSLVLFFNTIMLATMVYEILRLRHREHHWEHVVMLLGLSCVLGIPWGLIFFAVISGTFTLVAFYLFTIINSLQGFLIFLWYLAKVLQSRRSNAMQCTTSNSLKLQSSSSSI